MMTSPIERVRYRKHPPITQWIWEHKYKHEGENTIEETRANRIRAVFKKDENLIARDAAIDAAVAGELCLGGRIHAGAGSSKKKITLINCFVMDTIKDSMKDIMRCLAESAITMQHGGGIGVDFSTVRPKGGHRTGGEDASGPLSFADMWDSMCRTVMGAGERRGAMMATLRCDHPDIIEYIHAKQTKGRLTGFNTSVLVTEKFMRAVEQGGPWHLGFVENWPADRDPTTMSYDLIEDGKRWFIWHTMKARELWEMIMQATYVYAEPGVIFIDRINEQNNLRYCEAISCTNPCGEQPLPPYGDCDLGHLNLAAFVKDPFGENPIFEIERFRKVVPLLIRCLDNVLDVTKFPLDEQKTEALSKRRIGAGVTGLATMLQMMKIPYGSDVSFTLVGNIMGEFANQAYRASALLAEERGAFPLYNKDKFNGAPFLAKLDKDVRELVAQHGVRNGVVLTIAPVGTGSLFFDNISSGIEPVFSFRYNRNVKMPDDTLREFKVEDYGWALLRDDHHPGINELSDELTKQSHPYMVTTEDLTPEQHVQMQATCQRWVDASISKTINCPEALSYDDFKRVYWYAYQEGCKGCTTYRPNPVGLAVRGAILMAEGGAQERAQEERKAPVTPDIDPVSKRPRPRVLSGKTYKLSWKPHIEHAFYVTINDGEDGKPFELFINSKSVKHADWIAGLTRSVSAIFRRGGDISFIADELMEVQSHDGGAWIDGKRFESLVGAIGWLIKEHMNKDEQPNVDSVLVATGVMTPEQIADFKKQWQEAYTGPHPKGSKGIVLPAGVEVRAHARCPRCEKLAFIHQEGCGFCTDCGYSNCS